MEFEKADLERYWAERDEAEKKTGLSQALRITDELINWAERNDELINCPHTNCAFIGDASIQGHYICQDCGFKIDTLVYHFVNKLPHILLTRSVPISRECINYCIEQYWKLHNTLCYQKLSEEYKNNLWLKHQYSKIINFVLNDLCES